MDEVGPVWQLTQHAMLVAWERFLPQLQVSKSLRAAVKLKHLADLNLGARPLVGDQAVADAWGMEFRHYTTKLLRERLARLEAKIEGKAQRCEQQQTIIRRYIERQLRLGGQLKNLRLEISLFSEESDSP